MGEHMSKEIDKEFWNLVDERLHQRFLKEYGREPNSDKEQEEFMSRHFEAVARRHCGRRRASIQHSQMLGTI
jgi:hypothetical protein